MPTTPPRPNKLVRAVDVLARPGGVFDTDLGRLTLAWADIVGARVAAASTPTALKEGALYVRCVSAAWTQALTASTDEILAQITTAFPDMPITHIIAKTGRVRPAPQPPPAPPSPALSHQALQPHLEAALEQISDPRLRSQIRAAMTATASHSTRKDPAKTP